jgi:hypothetical protein
VVCCEHSNKPLGSIKDENLLPLHVLCVRVCVKKGNLQFLWLGKVQVCKSVSVSASFLGSTAQLRPWPPPQNLAKFLGGFSTIFFFTG